MLNRCTDSASRVASPMSPLATAESSSTAEVSCAVRLGVLGKPPFAFGDERELLLARLRDGVWAFDELA